MKYPLAAIGVLLLHASLLITCTETDQVEKKSGSVETEIGYKAPKFVETGTGGLSCPGSYRGIGVMVNWGSNRITEVAPGGPASLAGVLVGDTLLTDEWFGKYEPKTKIVIRIERDGVPMTLSVTIDNICIDE